MTLSEIKKVNMNSANDNTFKPTNTLLEQMEVSKHVSNDDAYETNAESKQASNSVPIERMVGILQSKFQSSKRFKQ